MTKLTELAASKKATLLVAFLNIEKIDDLQHHYNA